MEQFLSQWIEESSEIHRKAAETAFETSALYRQVIEDFLQRGAGIVVDDEAVEKTEGV